MMLQNIIRSKVGMLGLIAFFIALVTGTVSAHQPMVGGNVTCGSDGLYHIQWTVQNSENRDNGDMTFSANRGSFDTYRLGKRGTAFAYEDLAGNTSGTVILTVTANWPDLRNAPTNVVRTKELILKGDCQPKTPPTPVTPVATEEPTAEPSQEATQEASETPEATETSQATEEPTREETPVTPVVVTQPQPTSEPGGNGGYICWFRLNYTSNPWGGQPWGLWIDELGPDDKFPAFGGYLLVNEKDEDFDDDVDYVDVSIQTDTTTKRTGILSIARTGSDFKLTVSVQENNCEITLIEGGPAAQPQEPGIQPTGRPIPSSGSGELPVGRRPSNGGTNPIMPIGLILGGAMIGLGGTFVYRRRAA